MFDLLVKSKSKAVRAFLFVSKHWIYWRIWVNSPAILFHTERGRGIGRSRLPMGNPMWDSIPGPQDHNLSQRQTLNYWATQVPLYFLNVLLYSQYFMYLCFYELLYLLHARYHERWYGTDLFPESLQSESCWVRHT